MSGVVAVNLVTRLNDPSSAIRKTRETIIRSIENGQTVDRVNEVCGMLASIDDDDIVTQIIAEPSIEEHLRAVAFADESDSWIIGAKPSAIRCLARIDPRAAFVAAKAALRNTDAHDREYYPPLLTELDASAATKVLLEALDVEQSESVKKSIGRSLLSLDVADALVAGLESQNTNDKKVACVAAGWARDSVPIRTRLAQCLTDSEESVARAAAAALSQLSIRAESQLLGRAVIEATTEDQRWLYLDCIVSFAEPSDEHRTWPVYGPEIGPVLTPLQSKYALKRLERRRQKEKK